MALASVSPVAAAAPSAAMIAPLLELIHSAQRLLVVTGAGISTASGIPD
jgi:NAD+-dependent protein deacetylase sirtuin 4